MIPTGVRPERANIRSNTMVEELISSAMHSTAQGFVGVGCIFVYFAVMISAIIYRVKRGEHVNH